MFEDYGIIFLYIILIYRKQNVSLSMVPVRSKGIGTRIYLTAAKTFNVAIALQHTAWNPSLIIEATGQEW